MQGNEMKVWEKPVLEELPMARTAGGTGTSDEGGPGGTNPDRQDLS
jgi:hypothetical protein